MFEALAVVAVVAIICALIGWMYWLSAKSRERRDTAEADARKWEAMQKVVDPTLTATDAETGSDTQPPLALPSQAMTAPRPIVVDNFVPNPEYQARAARSAARRPDPPPTARKVPKAPDPTPRRPTDVWE